MLASGPILWLAPTGAAASPADVAATEAYLAAVYSYRQALVANMPQSISAVQAQSAKLELECPGILRGASAPSNLSTPRARGEFARRVRQLQELRAELTATIEAAYQEPNHEAAARLVASVSTLQWSSSSLTARVHASVSAIMERVDLPARDVCADMRAWVDSGYRTLSSETKAFKSAQATLNEHLRDELRGPTLERQLSPFEGAAAKLLIKRTAALEAQDARAGTLSVVITALQDVQSALGLRSDIVQPSARARSKRTVVARGRTAAGERFVAEAEQPDSFEPRCKLGLSIEQPPPPKTSGLASIAFTGSGPCLSHSYAGPQASVNCNHGLLTVQALTPASAATASLQLSDGHEITSNVIRAPKLGGRVGDYYQVVRGPSLIPVSLVVSDAAGHVLATDKLPAVRECTKHPLKYLPGGRPKTLASGHAPQGPSFSLVAERYSFLGHVHFQIKLNTRGEGEEAGIEGGFIIASSTSSVVGPGSRQGFALEESSACLPHPYTIVWGLLEPPGATVLVRSDGTLSELSKVAIPSTLHAGGALVYGAFVTPPSEVIVRNARRRTISSESRAASARAATEECEGETELTS